jgi:hypothetical protein
MKGNMSLEPIISLQSQQDVDKCVDVWNHSLILINF